MPKNVPVQYVNWIAEEEERKNQEELAAKKAAEEEERQKAETERLAEEEARRQQEALRSAEQARKVLEDTKREEERFSIVMEERKQEEELKISAATLLASASSKAPESYAGIVHNSQSSIAGAFTSTLHEVSGDATAEPDDRFRPESSNGQGKQPATSPNLREEARPYEAATRVQNQETSAKALNQVVIYGAANACGSLAQIDVKKAADSSKPPAQADFKGDARASSVEIGASRETKASDTPSHMAVEEAKLAVKSAQMDTEMESEPMQIEAVNNTGIGMAGGGASGEVSRQALFSPEEGRGPKLSHAAKANSSLEV